MMTISGDGSFSSIAQVIQLSVAPVFLLTGVGSLLGVMANRLSRIIDRSRVLKSAGETADDEGTRRIQDEIKLLERRAGLVNWAIGLCTTCAFLVCTIIVVLFVDAFFRLDLPALIAMLFIGAMTVLIAGLLCFLVEVRLSISAFREHPGGMR